MLMRTPIPSFKDETEFNKWMRSQIRARGYQCLHIREADIPGPLDLIIWKGPYAVTWIELKLDDRAVEVSQIEFMRGLKKAKVLHGVVRYRRDVEIFEVWQMNSDFELGLVFSTGDTSEMLDGILI